MDSIVNKLKISFPGRKYQIQQLCNLFGYKNETFVDCVYIYGPSSTGKSSIVTSVLDNLGIQHVRINLIECYSPKILFESILNQLSGHKVDSFKGLPYAKCDNIMDFIFNLKKCASEVDLNNTVIVLDKAERLRNMEYNLLPSFLKFQEISQLPISVILVSEIMFEKYYSKFVVDEPIKVYFPQYTQDELLEILCLDHENVKDATHDHFGETFEISNEFYENYLNIFLSVFYRSCRDLSELRYMSKLNFLKYCEPIAKGQYKFDDSMALWRNISPILKASLEVLYLRISSVTSEWKEQSGEVNKKFAFSKENLAQSLELPYYAKYLLIAAYLASYNPAKEDKRLFVKHHGKKAKRRGIKAKQIVSERLNTQLGPKAFGFERLVAIFYAILEEKVDFNSSLLVQISTLVELQLLSLISDNCDFDGRKYKCCVGYEFIQIISKTLDFHVEKYLVDFN